MYSSTLWRTYSCRKCNYANGGSFNPKSVCVCDDGSRFTGRLPSYKKDVVENKMINKNLTKNCCPDDRSKLFRIKSGLQPNENKYSYSYHSYHKNTKQNTYEKKLPTSKPNDATNKTYGYKGSNCSKINGCAANQTTWAPNNDKYQVQGAVSSSTRLDRLKLQAIRGSKRCSNDPSKCGGKYFAGKPRYDGEMFNSLHKEVNCPQSMRKQRARGVFSLYPTC
tara:strand:+ start:225 stop:890 length:666 start_codon:yes stop_codon:yes gene_type:complete